MQQNYSIEAMQECIQSKLYMILSESGFGKIEINVEQIRVDKVAITIQSGVSLRFIFTKDDIQSWLHLKQLE
ncbi:hypothetical protein [Iningainema tapete]|uniref:Uncharacterized protein n=1 Tax=Iningainema tapete BLCC-T55 TaxID=2748662 RepID=A0A8J6X9X0_9CYAN|nr:hypothetical protein [Iningainema tapete]MBD2770690.1 hypothetical protein [Iningainema tapete BLCC-T55]